MHEGATMRRAARAVRHPQGTGSLLVRRDRLGRETWYGKWRAGERQVMRRLGPRREPGESVGLTRRQAELELRRLMGEETGRPVEERLTLETLAPRYLAHKETIGLRRSTLRDYAGHLRVHLIPFFGGRSLDAVTPAEVEAFIRAKLREGKARKTVDDLVGLLSAMYRYAVKRGLARVNPLELADRVRAFDFDDGSATDYRIAGIEVDCKFSRSFGGWEIPLEAYGHLCLVIWADDARSLWSAGVVRIREEFLLDSQNRDRKRRLNGAGLEQIKTLRGSFALSVERSDTTGHSIRDARFTPTQFRYDVPEMDSASD
jgi:hypothetical protein